MAFKTVISLDADVTTGLGGVNKKTGKANPTKAEGYYLGRRQIESKKAKTGFDWLYFLQTPKGNLGVYGKTDLNKKMASVTPGTMIRITQSGMTPTPNGDMYKFVVEVDEENTIDVSGVSTTADAMDESTPEETVSTEAAYDSADDEALLAAEAEAAARAARVKALLAGKGKTK